MIDPERQYKIDSWQEIADFANDKIEELEAESPEQKTCPEIPPGWVECGGAEAQYAFNNKWERCTCLGDVISTGKTYVKPAPGFETHGADWWDKQPVEVVAIGNSSGIWKKLSIIPDTYPKLCYAGKYTRLFDSECPAVQINQWQDSIMVRPDSINEATK